MFFKNVFDKNSSPKYATDMQQYMEDSKNDMDIIYELSSKALPYGPQELYEILSNNNSNSYSYISPYDISSKRKLIDFAIEKELVICNSFWRENEVLPHTQVKIPNHSQKLEEQRKIRYRKIIENHARRSKPCSECTEGQDLSYVYVPYKSKRRYNPNAINTMKDNDYEKYIDKEINDLESNDAILVAKLNKDKKYNRRLESVRIDADNDCTLNLCYITEDEVPIPCIYPKKYSRVNKAAMLGVI